MNDLAVTALLIGSLFLILASGVWIGLTLSGVAWIGMQLFSTRPAGDAMAVTIWGAARLPRGDDDRLAGRRGHARAPDPALDHHDRLRRQRRRVDRAAVHRRRL